ncbi:amino acid adenylation domain-containing protein [Kitasatospora sp. NPDC058170]|uniref:non-ribosomal peptide synthetase n=1 Tax=Kitasatospora sp. NPDC058170 TaxID=3346364 RepID=UPI0036D7C5D4
MPELLPVSPSPDAPARPASPAQHGMWLTGRLGLAREALHLPVRISFDRVDAEALARAVVEVTRRHGALGARLVERDGRVLLERADRTAALEVVDATGDDPAGLRKRLAEEAARPFDPDGGPLVRWTLYQGPGGDAELLVVAHHAVFDGESKDVLVADLAAAYGAALRGEPGEPAEQPPAPLVVADAPDPELVRRAADWYGPRWAAATEPVLPGASRTPTAAGPGEAVGWRLDGAERAALAAAARRSGVTVFEFLLAALHGLLRRYGGEAVPVSVPLSTRRPEQAGEIGLFVNELPVHPPAGLDDATAFDEHARAVRAELRGGYPFRTVPFGSAVAGLGPRVGLTPVSLGYRQRRGPQPRFADTPARVDWAVFNGAARNTLHLQVVDGAEGVEFSLQHDPAVLPADAAGRIAGHFATLLAAAVAAPGTPLRDLPLLTAAEYHLVTEAWNDTARAYPADRTVLDLVRDRAAAAPEAVAVTGGGRRLTYRELLARVDELASALAAAGVRRGDLVAVHLDRTAELPAVLLAVLATGAGYLPLDPGYPEERLAFILADSGATLLLADREPAPRVAAAAPAVLRLADARGGGAPVNAAPGERAYVLYTSGSTGRPKGVEVGHRALVNLLTSFADRLGCGAGSVWLGLTSLSFDISGLELFLPLVTGGRLVVAGDGLAVDGAGLCGLVAAEGVTHVQATPSGWRVVLAGAAGSGAGGAGVLSSVVGLVGGEALALPLARELRAVTARLFNVYGPTETTVWSTCGEVAVDAVSVGIGRPIANTRAYVLDGWGRPLPVGVAGELFLGGDGVAEGYLGRPELTAERFVEDPFGPSGGRLYRTGDLVSWTAGGELEFHGRMDGQVKIRGHRIELGEIESALLEHPAVTEAAVAAHEETAGEMFLAGYLVVPVGVAPPTPAELREHLLRTLPGAMVPQRFLTLERLPLTPNGKLDRRALPVPPREAPATGPAAGAPSAGGPAEAQSGGPSGGPSDEVTETVRRIWSEVLDLPDIGPDEDLFDLGGHSLTIIQISARIRTALGVELDFDVFFDVPTPAGIAAAVRERR